MNCRSFNENIDEYIAENLPAELCESMRAHARQCEACRRELDLLEKALTSFEEDELFEPPTSFTDDVMNGIASLESKGCCSSSSSDSALATVRKMFNPLLSIEKYWIPVGAVAVAILLLVFSNRGMENASKVKVTVAQAPTPLLHKSDGGGELHPFLPGEEFVNDEGEVKTLELAESRGRIRILPGSSIRAVDVGLEQVEGTVVYDLDLRGRRFEIKTPPGNVIVWGTVFTIEVKGDSMDLQVKRGQVEFQGPDSTLKIAETERLLAVKGQVARLLKASESGSPSNSTWSNQYKGVDSLAPDDSSTGQNKTQDQWSTDPLLSTDQASSKAKRTTMETSQDLEKIFEAQ